MTLGFLDRRRTHEPGGLWGRPPEPETPTSKTPPSSTTQRKVSQQCHEECLISEKEMLGSWGTMTPEKTSPVVSGPMLENDDDIYLREKKAKSVSGILQLCLSLVVLSWLLGACGASWLWLLFCIIAAGLLLRDKLEAATQDAIRYESLRIHRRRALSSDETCEWLNILINRWWVFSSASIFQNLKQTLDPRLQEAKPAFLETIMLAGLTLGSRTPVIQQVRAWDVSALDAAQIPTSHHHSNDRPPPGLALAPTHTVALKADLQFDSDEFSAVLAAKLGGKGVSMDLDLAIEKLAIIGHVVVTITLNMEIPFPHISGFAVSFTEKPQVWFSVRILKSVQMMEVPVLKTWLHSLVMDALANAWVDPGQLEFSFGQGLETIVPEVSRGETQATGILTITLTTTKGNQGLSSDEAKWVVVYLGGQSQVLSTITPNNWEGRCSFLLTESPSNHQLLFKIKGKRLITTTLTQYEIPLVQYGLEMSRGADIVLQRKGKVMGSVPSLHLHLEYTPLTPLNLEADLPQTLMEHNEGGGVLTIMIHGADNLPMPDPLRPPSPYCLVFTNRRKVKTTHYVCGDVNPRWECGIEVLVTDLINVCISFAVCTLHTTIQDSELIGLYTMSLSVVELPMIRSMLPLTRSLNSPTVNENTQCNMPSVTVSLVFRQIASVTCNTETQNLHSDTQQDVNYSPEAPEKKNSINIKQMRTSSSSSTGQRRLSLGLLDDDDETKPKKWLSQAKQLLVRDGEFTGHQSLGEILASGQSLMDFTIISGKDLESKDLNGYSDPYCVVKVNGDVVYRTRVRKKTLNPIWDECLMIPILRDQDIMIITLWDHDTFGLRDFLGSVTLKEEDIKLMAKGESSVWCQLEGVKTGQLEVRVKVFSSDFQLQNHDNPQNIVSPLPCAPLQPRPPLPICPPTPPDDVASSSGEDSGILLPDPENHGIIENLSSTVVNSSINEDNDDAFDKCNPEQKPKANIIQNKLTPLHLSTAKPSPNRLFSGAFSKGRSKIKDTDTSVEFSNRSSTQKEKSAEPFINKDETRSNTDDGKNKANKYVKHENHWKSNWLYKNKRKSKSEELLDRDEELPEISADIPLVMVPSHYSEDEYATSEASSNQTAFSKQRKKTDGGFKAVKEKVRKGLKPLRRFRSEANFGDPPPLRSKLQAYSQEINFGGSSKIDTSGHKHLISHAKSQPNLPMQLSEFSTSVPSIKGITSKQLHVISMEEKTCKL